MPYIPMLGSMYVVLARLLKAIQTYTNSYFAQKVAGNLFSEADFNWILVVLNNSTADISRFSSLGNFSVAPSRAHIILDRLV